MHTLQSFNLQNSYMFQVSMADHQGVQLYKIVIRPHYHLNIRKFCEIINVRFTEANIYTEIIK